MKNLFTGWPIEGVAQIYVESATHLAPDFTVCKKYWKLSPMTAVMNLVGIDVGSELHELPEQGTPVVPSATPAWRKCFMKLGRFKGIVRYSEPYREVCIRVGPC